MPKANMLELFKKIKEQHIPQHKVPKSVKHPLINKSIAILRLYRILEGKYKGKIPRKYSKLVSLANKLASGDEKKAADAIAEIRKLSLSREIRRYEHIFEGINRELKGHRWFGEAWRKAREEERLKALKSAMEKLEKKLPRPKTIEERLEFEETLRTLAELQLRAEESRSWRSVVNISEILEEKMQKLMQALKEYLEGPSKEKRQKLRKLRKEIEKFIWK